MLRLLAVLGLAAGAAICAPGKSLATEEHTALAPVVVNASPFGYIGLKRGTFHFAFWRFVTFRQALQYVVINELEPDSPATKAGVRPGDRIVAVNGRAITEWKVGELKRLYAEVEIGTKTTIEIRRAEGGERVTLEVVAGRPPK
ncbi:MAG: PDZ domain-containing protein [Opitutae bacterium]|nr:PDZ domain-containing protein [Opitutae bacterium]